MKCIPHESRSRIQIILTGILFLILTTTSTAAENKPLVFGFLPIISTEKLVKRFNPLAEYLADELGVPVRLETAPNYKEFVRRTNKEKRYDIVFTAPHFYYLAQREADYRVVARVAAPSMKAIIVAPKSGSIKSLQDLRGNRLSTLDPIALGTVLVKAHLQKNGIDPNKDLTLVATPSHNASLLSAYRNATDAASLMIPPFKRAKPEIKDSMQIIDKTAGTPHMPLSVSSRLGEKKMHEIQTILLNMKKSEKGRKVLKHLSWPGFAKTSPAEYDSLGWAADLIRKKLD